MSASANLQLGSAFAAFPDDTAQSFFGDARHQQAITILHTSLEHCGQGRGLPWLVGNQLRMIIPRFGQHHLVLAPDILIHPTLGGPLRETFYPAEVGAPALVIEIAHEATARARDIAEGTLLGKPAVYASLGIAEYLVFDPSGVSIPTLLWARKLGTDGRYYPWAAAHDGRWQSILGIAFQPQESLLRVYDQDGQLVLTYHEQQQVQRQLVTQVREQHARIAALETAIQRLQGQ